MAQLTTEAAAQFMQALDGALAWRCIGPYRGGRTMAVVGHPTRPREGYMGTASGGVWRTTDAGISWHNLSDGYFKRGSVGALALAPSDPARIYVGMGECGLRANVTHGDGLYRSCDGGTTWSHCGLAETQNIGRILVHPHNPDLLYVAAFGHRFGPNPERGVYRSADGGQSWKLVLHVSDQAGAVDLAMNPEAPHILYAATWQAQRSPWSFEQRGPGSGLYKSSDGGESWQNLTQNPGFPAGPLGRIGIAASPVRPARLWVLVDAPEAGGLYRSDDAGATWSWLNGDRNFLVRAWYSARLVADPLDPDILFMPNRKLWRSTDGGRTFLQLNTPYWDQHDLWVDPADPLHLMVGTDGGAGITFDRGTSWSSVVNQPTAELYFVATDNRFPYHVYSAQQDNSTLCLPSRTDRGPISLAQLYDIGGGESGPIAVRPDNYNIVYSSDLDGILTRYDHASGQLQPITVWPDHPDAWESTERPYRFNWSMPVLLSPHDPNTLYTAANHLFRSHNEGKLWEVISPDLTRADVSRISAEGGETGDYCTIATLAESPLEQGVLWVGSDDGLVHISRDGSMTWQNVTPPDLPPWALTRIEASPHHPDGAYLAATCHMSDDYRPYIWKTVDYGTTWELITAGIPGNQFVRVVRADPVRQGLLFAGTEAGVYCSYDDGVSWQPLQLNLPAVAIYDLALKESDLIAATHGRGLWILDDLSPLRQVSENCTETAITLFEPRPTYRVAREAYWIRGYIHMGFAYAAPNPPTGVIVDFYLRELPAGEIAVTLLDATGEAVASWSSAPPTPAREPLGPYDYVLRDGVAVLSRRAHDEEEHGIRVGARVQSSYAQPTALRVGLNRCILELLYPAARTVPSYMSQGITSPLAVPGSYTVRLTVEGATFSVPALILADPRTSVSDSDLQAQFLLLHGIRDAVTLVHDTVALIRDLHDQLLWLEGMAARLIEHGALRQEVVQLLERLRALETSLIQPAYTERSGELSASHYRLGLSHRLEALGSAVAGYDGAPTAQAATLFVELSGQVDRQVAELRTLLHDDLSRLGQLIHEAGLPLLLPLGALPSQQSSSGGDGV